MMMQRIRRMQRARQLDPEAGFSLIELIVAIAILTVLSAIVVATYSSTVRALADANTVNLNSEQASNAMNESARQIRAATSNPVSGSVANDPAIVSGGTESLTLYAYVNLQSSSVQQPEQVRLRVDPTTRQYKEDIWSGTQSSAGYWTFPATSTTPTQTRTLAGFVAPHTGSNLYVFTYMAGTTALTVPTTGAFTTAQLNSITAIQITLTVETNITTATQSVTLQNTVGMPNLNE
jgi:prepilin-type N-terminal cleavage/methylation domain-containing protein